MVSVKKRSIKTASDTSGKRRIAELEKKLVS